jgi:ATP-dependent Clp protease ATP-binding subunit ClpA
MPLNEPGTLAYFRRAISVVPFAVFRQTPLPPQHFAAENPAGADLLLKRRDDTSSYLFCISDTVRYLGKDRNFRQVFASNAHRGWRVLAIIQSAEEQTVLREADAILGLDGGLPRLPGVEQKAPHPIIMRNEEFHPRVLRTAEGTDERFGVNLVAEAREGRFREALHRTQEISALTRILLKKEKNAACLLGEPGVGKTAVVEGLALRVAQGRVPFALSGVRILDVNLSFLSAGATYKNQFEGRMKELLDLARRDRNVILFLDELHAICASGSDASQMVKSDLGRGRIRCLGATTVAEYKIIEADAALARRFQTVPVHELTRLQTVEVLQAARSELEAHHGVVIPGGLLGSVVELACRYVPHRRLPDKALDLLDEACACAALGFGNPVPPIERKLAGPGRVNQIGNPASGAQQVESQKTPVAQ